jgi:AcrR family transcriptional regulator
VGDASSDSAVDDSGANTDDDPLRAQLLDAAAQVFASKGYFGTKIMDIVKAADLSSGAVYGRFASKDELWMEAILRQVEKNAIAQRFEGRTVAQAMVEASRAEGPLDDVEAMQLEAFIAARREPNIASAIAENRKRFVKTVVEPLVQRAIAEGSASPKADFESIVYFIETLQLGLLVQRGAGQQVPDSEAWQRFLARLLSAMARPAPSR